MELARPPGRPAKIARTCFKCKNACPPKDGDWFTSEAMKDRQLFLCKSCENNSLAEYQRVTPLRF